MPNWIYHIFFDALIWVSLSLFGFDVGMLELGLLIASNSIDIDHLFAKPIYDKQRNSIGFHILHKKRLFPLSIIGCFLPAVIQFFFIGIVAHLFLDWIEFAIFRKATSKPSKTLDEL